MADTVTIYYVGRYPEGVDTAHGYAAWGEPFHVPDDEADSYLCQEENWQKTKPKRKDAPVASMRPKPPEPEPAAVESEAEDTEAVTGEEF